MTYFERNRAAVLERQHAYYRRNRSRVLARIAAYRAARRRPKPTPAQRFARFVDTTAGAFECWPWTSTASPNGYGRFSLDGRTVSAHRYALELKLGRPIRPGYFACHACDNRPCVNPAHLFEGTVQDNVDDMVRKGRSNPPTGDRHGSKTKPESVLRLDANGNAHLTSEQVLEARARLSRHETTQRQIAAELGVDPSTISRAVRGDSWRTLCA